MLCMRGAKHRKAWDAQLVQRYTDIPFFVLVDNESDERINGIWERARKKQRKTANHICIIDEPTLFEGSGLPRQSSSVSFGKNLLQDNLSNDANFSL